MESDYFTPDRALGRATTDTEILKALERKAQEYTDALFLEIGAPVDLEMSRSARLALFQDFIEIYNVASQKPAKLPDSGTAVKNITSEQAWKL
tara:strand:+ start:572 stop:850 length:279 start_codon:yes stop_codon:yes gene_type:complete